jgi:hypothetical protein
MQITRNTNETATGPSEWFSGAVYIDTLATPTEPSRLGAASVHFTPGADRVAHPPPRADHPRHRGRRPLPAPGWRDRGDPPGRPRVLRARRGPLARRRPKPLHDPHRDAGGRRLWQPRRLGRARHRRGVRRRTSIMSRSASSAFGPTDSPVLSGRAKIPTVIQAVLSLVVVIVLVA